MKRPTRHSKTARGFSLAEILVVVAIIGIMAGVAVPAFLNALKSFRLRTAGRQVMGDMQVARQKAITRNRDYFVFFHSDNSYDIVESNLRNGTALSGINSVRIKGPIQIASHLQLISAVPPAGATTPVFPATSLSPVNDLAGVAIASALYTSNPAVIFHPDGSVASQGKVWVALEASDRGPRFLWFEASTNSIGKVSAISGP